jgi:hypothetical protein
MTWRGWLLLECDCDVEPILDRLARNMKVVLGAEGARKPACKQVCRQCLGEPEMVAGPCANSRLRAEECKKT